jgi:hypothetical protein
MAIKLNPEVAVIDDAQLTSAKMERVRLSESIANLGDLARQALAANVSHVWALPGTQLSQTVDKNFILGAGKEWDVFASYSRLEEDRPMFARIWRKNTSGREGRTIYVGFPEWGTWPWKCPDVVSLLATLTYTESALGLPVVWSSGHMALDLLKALNLEKRASWLSPLTTDLRTLPTNDGRTLPVKKCARDLTWKRTLTPRDKKKKWVHKYDKNSMYLAAATGLLVGEGDPEHVEGNAFDERLPGIWRIRAERADTLYDGVQLPSPTRMEWLTTAMATCAMKMGYQVEMLEGYQWNKPGMYHRTLESWANTLWAARQSLKFGSPTFDPAFKHQLGRENAYNTIGAIAHVGVGKLADESTSGGLYRPDMWALVVGRACANIFYNIESIRKTAGLTPVLVYTDSLWYVSDDPDPETAVPGIIDKQNKLGGYKVVYEQPLAMSKAVVDAFAKTPSPTKLVRTLNGLAGEDDTITEKVTAEVLA